MNKCSYRLKIFLLSAAFTAMMFTACGGPSGATMFLRKTEGTVNVSDAEEKYIEIIDNLGLFSGYGVDTMATSYAWIDLDNVKLVKLDENTEADILQDGKKLSVDVKTGKLFFHVAEPLKDDETMDIQVSTMMVGIRGTCGWVEVLDDEHMNVYILEGTVECTSAGQTASVSAGETAVLTADGSIEVSPFTSANVPAFVVKEFEQNDDLNNAVLEASGINVANDPLRKYWPAISHRIGDGEILFAEEIDFEGDDSPELAVLYTVEEEFVKSVKLMIGRGGPDGFEFLINQSDAGIAESYLGYAGPFCSKISLVESEGRQYIMSYSHGEDGTGTHEWYNYEGSVAQHDGDEKAWGRVDGASVWYDGDDGEYRRYELSENGLRHGPMADREDSMSVGEFEAWIASFTEVRVLHEYIYP